MMSETVVTDRTGKLTVCRFCGHAGAHAPATVTPSGGVRYCSSCPECEMELDQMANTTHSAAPQPATLAGYGVA
jgi:hypothetical protein